MTNSASTDGTNSLNLEKILGTPDDNQIDLFSKLWIYTNYNCNLSCSYCVAKSTPRTPDLAISKEIVERIVDEATELGFQEIFFTGGEPFIHKDIFNMLAYASKRIKTTVLTNAMLFQGQRLEQFLAIGPNNLTVQVSLDGGRPEHHDAYRGDGTWSKTEQGIRLVQRHGFHVRLSTTETPANSSFLDEVCAFHKTLGIPEEDHFIRPLAKRGFSQEGIEVNKATIIPEMTINRDGVFWHPLSTDKDMLVSQDLFPLSKSISCLHEELSLIAAGGEPQNKFT